jgi:2-hydroxychromene-2-carboxylate isomerase
MEQRTQRRLEVWIEYASTYSYLTVSCIGSLAAQREVELDWQPFWLGPVRERGLGAPFPDDAPRSRYMWRDVERRAARLGLPYRKPEQYPVNSLQTARVALVAAREGWCLPFSEKVFSLHWGQGVLIGTPDNLRTALQALGKDVDEVIERAQSADNKAAFKAQTERALERGIFGAPSFVTCDGELFWGDDRLEDALDWACTCVEPR